MTYSNHIKFDPKYEWLLEQEKKNTPEGQDFWLWDNDLASLFIFADLFNEGDVQIDYTYTFWLSMMMKHSDEPYLSFIKDYLKTKERKYTFDLNGITPFKAMKKFGSPYILSIFYLHTENHPELYDKNEDGTVWWFDTSSYTKFANLNQQQNQHDIKYIILNEDNNGYYFMNKDQIFVEDMFLNKEICEKDYNSLISMSASSLHTIIDKVRQKRDFEFEKWTEKLDTQKIQNFQFDLSDIIC